MGIRERTEQKVFTYIEEHGMLVSGDKVIAGVSGGADSLCMLFLLLEYARKIPLTLRVVHIDHGLRPDAAEDARYVEELCRRENIPFLLISADAAGLAREKKCSEEDAGRRIRYRAFYRAAEDMGGAKVAVAHNRNDNAETMLFHLFRGSGLKGLCGISAVRNEIIRPILCLERREAEAYLKEREIAWRTDSTNNEDNHTRNRIRHHILPYAEQEISSGAVEHMAHTAEMLEEAEDYLQRQTEDGLKQCLTDRGGEFFPGSKTSFPDGRTAFGEGGEFCFALDIGKFLSFHVVLQKRMLHTLIRRLSPTGKDIHQVHIRDVLGLFSREGNGSVDLPFGIRARKQYDFVILERDADIHPEAGEPESGERQTGYESPESGGQQAGFEVHGSADLFRTERAEGDRISEIEPPGTVPSLEKIAVTPFVYDLGKQGKLEFTVFLLKKGTEIPQNRYTKWFDCDKIKESLVIRSRRGGDYLTVGQGAGRMVHKSLKDYMITEKIPRQFREEIPVIAAGSHVLWLVGWRISEYFKVDSNTRHILQVSLRKQ